MAEGDGASRVALVTGAARGIGRGITLRLAADGLDVAVNDIESNSDELDSIAEEIREAGRRAAAVTADVSDPGEVEGMVGRVADELAAQRPGGERGDSRGQGAPSLTPEDWDRIMAINLRCVFLCYQEAARQMIRQGTSGKIIGVASIVAYRPLPLLGTTRPPSGASGGSPKPRRWSGRSITSPSTPTARG